MSESPVPTNTLSTVGPAPKSLGGTLAITIRQSWQPVPIALPTVDPRLTELSSVERSAEVFRYKLHQLEYALSPDGGLRAWFKLNLLLCLMLGIPLLFVVPVITGLLTSFASWTTLLLQIALNLLYTLLVVIAIGTILMFLFRGLGRR